MIRPINRGTRDLLPPTAYTTYQIAAPRATHHRRATCEEYGCERWRNGWRVRVQALNEAQRHEIIKSRYRFRQSDVDADHTYWDFEPGQPCFQASTHTVPVGRPALFVVRHGDHRYSTVERQHVTPEAWRDDFAEHQDRLATIARRG